MAAVVIGICVATCGWAAVVVAFSVGGLVGVGGQLISDIIFWAATGEWESSLEDYVGAFLGGAVGGILMLHPGNITLACLMDGMVSTLGAAKSISSAFPSLKRLSGRGSYGAAYQMVLTKLKNNTCKNISLNRGYSGKGKTNKQKSSIHAGLRRDGSPKAEHK